MTRADQLVTVTSVRNPMRGLALPVPDASFSPELVLAIALCLVLVLGLAAIDREERP